MDKFDIRVEGPFEYKCTDGPFTMEDLAREWPEYLINWEPKYTVTLLDNQGNVLRHESCVGGPGVRTVSMTIEEWNINVPEQGKRENT